MKTTKILKIFFPLVLVLGACAVILLTMGVPVGPEYLGSTDTSYPVIANGNIYIAIKPDEENNEYQILGKDHELADIFTPVALIGNVTQSSELVQANIDLDEGLEILQTYIDDFKAKIIALQPNGSVILDEFIIDEGHVAYCTSSYVTEVDGNKIIYAGSLWSEDEQVGPETEFNVRIDVFKVDILPYGAVILESLNTYIIPDLTTTQSGIDECILEKRQPMSDFAGVLMPAGIMLKPVPTMKPELPLDGLQLWLEFEDKDDLGYDSSGNGNHFDNPGNKVTSEEGKYGFGNAGKFTAAQKSYLISPDEAALHITGDMTVCGWVNIYGYPEQGFVIAAKMSGSAGQNVDYAFYIEGGTMCSWNGDLDDPDSNVYGDEPVPDGWHHVAFVKKWNEENEEYDIAFYLDGEPNGTSGQTFPSPAPDAPAYICHNGLESYADGMLDELAILDRASEVDEVKSLAGVEIGGEEMYPAIEGVEGLYFTLASITGDKLIGMGVYKVLDEYEGVEKEGLGFIGESVSGNKMGVPVAYEDSVVVLDVKEGDGGKYLRLRMISPDGGDPEEAIYGTVMPAWEIPKSGTISVVEYEGTAYILAPWHIRSVTDGEPDPGHVIYLRFDASNLDQSALTSDVYYPPFDTTYLKLITEDMTVGGVESTWVLYANQAISYGPQEAKLIPPNVQLEDGETSRSIAVGDLDGDDYKDIVFITNLGNAYVFNLEMPSEPAPAITDFEIEPTYAPPFYIPYEKFTKLSEVYLFLAIEGDVENLQVKFSANENFSGANWESFVPNVGEKTYKRVFTLPSDEDGEKTVWVKVRYGDYGEESPPEYASIILDTKKPVINSINLDFFYTYVCESNYVIKGTCSDEHLGKIEQIEYIPSYYNDANVTYMNLDTYTGKFEVFLYPLQENKPRTISILIYDKAGNSRNYKGHIMYKKPDLVVTDAHYEPSKKYWWFWWGSSSPAIIANIDNIFSSSSYKTYSNKSFTVSCKTYWSWGPFKILTGWSYKTIPPNTPLPKEVTFGLLNSIFNKFKITVDVYNKIKEGALAEWNNSKWFNK